MIEQLEQAHFNMLEQQLRPSNVLDSRVLTALEKIKRTTFVDDELAGLAYADMALPIGFGQVMLPAVVQGRLLQAINVQEDEHVLEIGTGTGYLTALLAQLAQHVTTVEIVPELSAMAQQHLAKLSLNNVTYQIGDASKSWALADRVAVIIITAAFVSVPDDYLQSLSVGGRMLVVVGKENNMNVQIIHRITERGWHTESIFETRIPAMINAEDMPKFEF